MGNTFGSYKRVFMLGIDGMGAFNKNADTPNIDRLFANGATTYTSMSSYPTVSSFCWTSMLTGSTSEAQIKNGGNMRPIPELPTVFRLIKDKFPQAETAAFTDWAPIALEIISPDGGIDTYDVGEENALCQRLLEYLDDHDPKMLFVQFDNVDTVGHFSVYGSQAHLDSISHADSLLGKVLDKYEEKGLWDDTLFIVTADHGGTASGSHGEWSDVERFVFLGVAGKNVLHGDIGTVHVRDYPSIVLHALGIDAPEFNPDGYSAQLPLGIFEGEGVTERQELYPKPDNNRFKNEAQPQKGDGDYIGNFIDDSRIAFWQTFENGVEDVTGKCRVSMEKGHVKTYNNGLVGKCGEFGNGVLKIKGMERSEVFSFAFWFKTTNDTRWMDLLSNRDDVHPSFSIAPYGERVGIYVKDPDGTQHERTLVQAKHFEESVINVWTHFMFEVDTKKNEITCFVNFEEAETIKAERDLAPHFDMSSVNMALDQYSGQLFYKMFDDIMVINGSAPVEELKKYYTCK